MQQWRLGPLAREAARNVLTWRGREAVALVAGVVAAVGAVFVSGIDAQRHHEVIDRLVREGWTSVLMESDAGGVDPAACGRLLDIEGVATAGWFVRESPATLTAFPAMSVPVVTMNGSLFRYASDAARVRGRPEGLIGAEARASNAGHAPLAVHLAGHQIDTSVSQRLSQLGLGGTVVVPAATVNQPSGCAVVFDPRIAMDAPSLAAGLSGAVDEPPVARRAASAGSIALDPMGAYRARLSRWAGHAALAVAGVAGLTAAVARRPEFAVYRLAGTSRSDLSLMLVAEAVLHGAAVIVGSTLVLAVAGLPYPYGSARAAWMLSAAGCYVVVLALGKITVVFSSSVSRSLKER